MRERSFDWLSLRSARNFPNLWARIGPLSTERGDSQKSFLHDGEYADLDAACASAYHQLAGRYRKVGRTNEAALMESSDPGAAPDQWDPVLKSAIAESELRELAALVLPTDTVRGLMSLDLTLMAFDEIVEELYLWAKRSKSALVGDLPSIETLQAILALWIDPEMAVSLDRRPALETLVADRSLARATRYLALRARNVHPRSTSQ